jgi:hypothetical protein
LVHEYLNLTANKLTAITLSEENSDQNFEDWDDVGLNISKPLSLLKQFRHYESISMAGQEHVHRITQLEKEIQSLNGQVLALKRENESLNLKLKKISLFNPEHQGIDDQSHKRHSSISFMDSQRKAVTPDVSYHRRNNSADEIPITFLLSSPSSKEKSPQIQEEEVPVDTPTTIEEDIPADKSHDLTDNEGVETLVSHEGQEIRKLHMSISFRQELLSIFALKTDHSEISLELSQLADPQLNVLSLFAKHLPVITQNIEPGRIECVITVLLCVISRHTNPKERDKLLNILFNLIEKPTPEQRHMIMTGCIAFAKLNGPAKVEGELLPQMWEQISHKHRERRLLVAESCGLLAPHIPPELRSSLVLSIVQQMLLDDKSEGVRESAAKSLAILVAFIDDEDKFKQCWELLLKALNDTSQMVSTAATNILLPALSAWAHELDKFESEIILYFLSQLYTCVKHVSRSDGESGSTERCQQYLVTLTRLVPWHFASVLLTGPYMENIEKSKLQPLEVSFPHPFSKLLDISVIIGDGERLSLLMAEMEKEIEKEDWSSWKKLIWFHEECLRYLLKIIDTLGFSQPEILHTMSTLVSAYCTYFGRKFTQRVIKPYFESAMTSHPEGRSPLTLAIFPLYLSGILTCFKEDEGEMKDYFYQSVVKVASSYSSIDGLKAAILELKRNRKLHSHLVQLLEDLSCHSEMNVRRYVAILLGLMISDIDEKLVSSHVVKTLLKLSTDTELSVKLETIDSLGNVVETISRRDVIDEVHRQFESFVQHDDVFKDFMLYTTILKTLARISTNADPLFRDKFIIPYLTTAARQNNSAPNKTQREDVVAILLQAYKKLSSCFISVELLSDDVVPGLKYLLKDCQGTDVDTVKQLLKDVETKIEEHQRPMSSDSSTNKFFGKFKKDFDLTPQKMSFSFKKKN